MGKPIYEMTSIELIMLLQEVESQELRNRIILELTYRMYVPFKDKTFEEMLVENGYRIIENDKNKNKI